MLATYLRRKHNNLEIRIEKHWRHGNRFAAGDRRRYFLGGRNKSRKKRLLPEEMTDVAFYVVRISDIQRERRIN